MENEESKKQLSHEKTATTVEVASTKVERTTNVAAPTVTGRTPWDALVDMGAMLGRLTPWIVMIAGGLYGVYKFTTVREDAQKEANDRLLKTYAEIGKAYDAQMDELSKMLKLNKETAADTAEKVKEAEEANQKINEAKEKFKQAEKATDDAKRQNSEAQRQLIKTGDRVRQLVDQQRQFADTKRELDRKQAVSAKRAEHITELRGKLIDMANNVVRSTDSSVAALGRQIIEESSLEVTKLLEEYAKQPVDDTAKSLDELIGTPENILNGALSPGLGFAFWQKYSNDDGTTGAYIGVVRQTVETDEGVVFISVEEKKVSNVDVFPQIVSVAGWGSDDWNKPIAYNLYVRPNGEPGVDSFTPKSNLWTIPETTDFPKGANIYKTETPLPFMSLDYFKKKLPKIFKAANDSNQKGFSDMVTMLDNEKGVDANQIAEPFSKEMPKGLSETFVQLLVESIKRAPEKSVKISSVSDVKPEVYGHIAAMALKTGFKIEDVRSMQPASGSSRNVDTSSIVCRYSTFGKPVQHARLTFAREAPDGKWKLLNFENPVDLSSTSAE